MMAHGIKLYHIYRMTEDTYLGSVQANGKPFTSLYVTIMRIKFPAGRKRAWYFDEHGNAFRSEDLAEDVTPVDIECGVDDIR